MKKRRAFYLQMSRSAWLAMRVGDGGVEQRDLPMAADGGEPDFPTLATTLQELGYLGEGVCLGLPSSLVLSAQVDATNLPRKDRQTTLLYRLEEQLPLEAERLTADFLPPAGGRTIGVAVETGRVLPLVDRLAEAGIEVADLRPTALLAAWQVAQNKDSPRHYLLLISGDSWDLLRLSEGRPVSWHTTATDPEELVRSLGADFLATPVETDRPVIEVVGDLDPAVLQKIEQDAGVTLVRSAEPSVAEAAAKAALSAEHGAGWVDLRRDALSEKNLGRRLQTLLATAVVLAVAFLVVVTGLCYWRGQRYAELTRRYDHLQTAEYQSVYPTGAVPPSVASRLRSEYARLATAGGEGTSLPRRFNALEQLRGLVANLPGDVRCRLTAIELSPASVLVEGQARSHGDAEQIARALRSAGLDVDPPATEQASNGVAFTLNGKPAAPTKLPAASSPPRPVTSGGGQR